MNGKTLWWSAAAVTATTVSELSHLLLFEWEIIATNKPQRKHRRSPLILHDTRYRLRLTFFFSLLFFFPVHIEALWKFCEWICSTLLALKCVRSEQIKNGQKNCMEFILCPRFNFGEKLYHINRYGLTLWTLSPVKLKLMCGYFFIIANVRWLYFNFCTVFWYIFF